MHFTLKELRSWNWMQPINDFIWTCLSEYSPVHISKWDTSWRFYLEFVLSGTLFWPLKFRKVQFSTWIQYTGCASEVGSLWIFALFQKSLLLRGCFAHLEISFWNSSDFGNSSKSVQILFLHPVGSGWIYTNFILQKSRNWT